MNLQTKSVVSFNVVIVLVCICMAILGYRSADNGFGISLQSKASSNVKSILEIVEFRYPGEWHIEAGGLYKGKLKIDGNNEVVDFLGAICEGQVTIFQNDTRVATTVKGTDGQRSVGTKASDKVIEEVIKGGKSYTGRAEVVGQDYHAAYVPIKNGSGNVIGMIFVGLPASSMSHIQNDFIFTIAITVVVIILVMGIGSWIVIGRETRKLAETATTVDKIAGGDLRIADLPVTSQDEIGTLANGVNEMKRKLNQLIRDVADASERVAASSEEMSASTEHVAETTVQAAVNATAMTEGASKQAETINGLQNIINDMRDKMQELHESANAMNTVARHSEEKAHDGKQKVNFAVEQIKSIAEQVSKSAEVVGELGKRSDEIGKIVDTIAAIADQTNLLALNAAIEAARAGEHGRGFAVVAEEVRKLAEQSSIAAKNISELITTIQEETSSAVEAIELGNRSVHEGSTSVLATGDAFNAIEEQVEKLNENVQRSIAHIAAVNTTSHDILNAIEVVQAISHKSTQKAQNVSAAAEEQAATIHEMHDASTKMSELAQQLQNEVHKFNLSM
ncbi:MAG: methyl-accepting chemotaxis protein [Selenomonadaceae bacterium]|nr:methyl-accepting chemotaxis protein [Selenomonadaceae bacterium]